ncbi:MAG: TraR/DksA C4-type zinc finger protein [Jatrophihabitantaceae bacterium]
MTRSALPASRGAHVTQTQLAVLRGMLEQQRRFRLDQLEQLQQAGPGHGADREITQSLVAGARAALRDVVDALQRMRDGRYGACRRCTTPLPIERLEVLPQVSLCMACQRAEQAG